MILFQNDTFYLETAHTSYVMRVLNGGILANVYYGQKIGRYPMQAFSFMKGMGYSPHMYVDEKQVACTSIAWEMPTFGRGDFGTPGITVLGKDQRPVNELVYDSYEIIDGKEAIRGLPSFDRNLEGVKTLKIKMTDEPSGYQVILYYSVFEKEDAIVRHTEIRNLSDTELTINAAASAVLELSAKELSMTSFNGGWAKERGIDRYELHHGISSVESRKGASGHHTNPSVILSERHTTEDSGEVYGLALVYSGDFRIAVEMNETDQVRVVAGIHPERFTWRLKPGEGFETPECVLTFSDQGFNGMSHHFHELCRRHLGRCADPEVRHPIVINNWEATYFDFNEEKLITFIEGCKGLGIDTMVLDDGWFGHRDWDDSSLGDWYLDQRKFPNGLKKVIETCHSQGMKFGIWFEPEMISRDSELYRAHPDWCIHTDAREPRESRNQLVLDLSRAEIVDHVFDVISGFLSEYAIGYVKWDMNRNITDNGSNWLGRAQGEHAHRYILGLYDLMERLQKAHPDVFFEGCAGGGGRMDFGVLYYMTQIWTSDDSDAIERLRIQYATSLIYPPATMSAHVSAVPNHQTGRITPFKTRGDVAQMCNFGYELDVTKLTEEEKKEIPRQVKEHRVLEPLIAKGDYYRLQNPFEGRTCAWELVNKERTCAYVMYAAASITAGERAHVIKPKGLDPDTVYQVCGTQIVADGRTIMHVGIPITDALKEYETRTFWITQIESDKKEGER